VNSTSVSARGRIAVFSHAPQIPFGARSARQSLYLDRRYIADPRLALDLRLIALSFAITALGKRRARRLLIRRSVRSNSARPPPGKEFLLDSPIARRLCVNQ
jgi:hypothetical protein